MNGIGAIKPTNNQPTSHRPWVASDADDTWGGSGLGRLQRNQSLDGDCPPLSWQAIQSRDELRGSPGLHIYSICKRVVENGDWLRADIGWNCGEDSSREAPVPFFHGGRNSPSEKAAMWGQAPSAKPKQPQKPERDGASPHFRTPGHSLRYLSTKGAREHICSWISKNSATTMSRDHRGSANPHPIHLQPGIGQGRMRCWNPDR